MAARNNYFKTFCKVSKALGTTIGKQEILNLIVESSIEAMEGKAACLLLADKEQDIFVPVAQKGLSDKYLHAKPMRAKTIVKEILNGGYLAIRDATTDSRLENHEEKKAEGIASILVVPVMVRNKAIGVLSLYTAEPRDFSSDEIEFQAALAEQGGMAIQNARLVERLWRNADLFTEMASNINSSLDIRRILHILTADTSEAFGMKGAVIRLWNRGKGTLDLAASYGLSEDYLNKGPIPAKAGIAFGLDGETTVVPDVGADERVLYKEALLKEGITSLIAVPIKSRDEVIGVMKLFSADTRVFQEDVTALLTAIGHAGGLAIHNASMYLMLEQDKKKLEEDIWSHRSWF